jgi:hypothetical protein
VADAAALAIIAQGHQARRIMAQAMSVFAVKNAARTGAPIAGVNSRQTSHQPTKIMLIFSRGLAATNAIAKTANTSKKPTIISAPRLRRGKQVVHRRRFDAYETRARELAVAAGQDPDARAERPGAKSMPVWCTYRDAARAEHLAAEAAALVLPPQAPAFQNAPLQVFGRHDEATIAQMQNCMGVGNVVAGVVCADGHLGYAQPVGGVIAYVGQISISGVGFDIGCGNMAVRLDTP